MSVLLVVSVTTLVEIKRFVSTLVLMVISLDGMEVTIVFTINAYNNECQ